jgi:hypothetical protein
VRALARLLALLLIPLVIVMAVRDPHAVERLFTVIFTVGARMLNDTAVLLDRLLDGH